MMSTAPVELCDACGFARAMLTLLDHSAVVVRSVYIPRDPELSARVLEVHNATGPRLDQLPIEAEMIRGRAPILIADAPIEQRTQPPFVTLFHASAYVAAPIFDGRGTIGFLHADLYDRGREPDEIDRDRLWAFAEGLGSAIERAILYERLRADRDLAASLWRSTGVVLADVGVEVEPITHSGNPALAEADQPARRQATTRGAIMDLLTKRERGVLALMVQGATNAAIGEELLISQGTVKSHVASILRKLGAANRADAVARYFQGTQLTSS